MKNYFSFSFLHFPISYLPTFLFPSLLLSFFLFPLFTSPAHATNQCQYSSTQARVHKDISDPWKQHMTIGCNKTFEVASFHDNTGVYANDTSLRVTGPNGFNKLYLNGQKVTVPDNGMYILSVSTNGRYGDSCQQQATVTVACNQQPTNNCPYTSTQARIQKNIHKPWVSELTVPQNYPGFNTGSFHNHTGQFATDTFLFIQGPNGFYQPTTNANRVKLYNKGTYTLHAYTSNYTGANCHAKAKITVL